MKTTIDLQTLLGFFSATGLPPLFKAVIAFLHPSIYTLVCGQGYYDGAAACYADDRAEAILYLVLAALAVAYGVITLARRLSANPTPEAGTQTAVIPTGSVPVVSSQGEATGKNVAQADPNVILAVTPANVAPPKQGAT